jgi:hypothetical protein
VIPNVRSNLRSNLRPGIWQVLTLGLISGLLVDVLLRIQGLNWLAPLVLVPLILALKLASSIWGGVLTMLVFALPSNLWVHEGGFVLFPEWTFLGFTMYAFGYALLGAWVVWLRQRGGTSAGAWGLVSGWAALMFVLMSPNVTGAFAHVAWAALPVIVMDTPLLPTAAWSGFSGLGVLLLLLNLGMYTLVFERRWIPLAMGVGTCGLAVWLAAAPKATGQTSDFTIVQHNAPYLEHALSDFHQPLADQLLEPLAQLSQNPKGVLLWPEASVPGITKLESPNPKLR